MSLNSEKLVQSVVYLCGFECYIHQANVSIKFPCNYFIQWRTTNSKFFSKSERRNPIKDKVTFNQSIRLTLQLIHDNSRNQFLKRQTIIELFLNSKSRPSESKLVGRVNIEVSSIINHSVYALPTVFKLEFCSIQASLVMNFRFLSKSPSSITAASLDRSSIAEYIAKNQSRSQIKSQSLVLSKFKNFNFEDQRRQVAVKHKQQQMQIDKEQQFSELSILSESLLTNQDKLAKYQKIQDIYQYINGNHIDKIKLRQFFIIPEQRQDKILYQIEQQNPLQEQSLNHSQSNAIQQLKIQLAQAKQQILQLAHLYEQQKQDFWHAESISNTLSQINTKIQDQKQILTAQITSLRKINQQLQSNIRDSIQKIIFLENSNNNVLKQKEQLQKVNSQYSQTSKKNISEIETLKEQLRKMSINKKSYAQMQLKMQGLQLQMHQQAKKLEQTEQIIVGYEKKFLQLQLLVQKFQKQNHQCNQRVRQCEQTQIQLRKKINDLDLQNYFLSHSVQQLEAQKIEGQREVRQKQALIDNLILQVKQAEKKITQSYCISAHQNNAHYLQDYQYPKLSLGMSNVEGNKDSKNDQRLLQKCEFLQQQCQRLKQTVQNLTANFEEHITQSNQLQHQLLLAQQQQSINEEIIKNLQTQLAQIRIRLQQRASKQSEYEEQILLLKNQLKNSSFFQKRQRSRPWLSPPRISMLQQSAKQEIIKESKALAESNMELKQKIKDLNEKIGSLVIRHNQTKRKLQNQIENLNEQLIEVKSHISSLQSQSSFNKDL